MKLRDYLKWDRAAILKNLARVARLAQKDPALFVEVRGAWNFLEELSANELDAVLAAAAIEKGGASTTPFLSDAEIDELCAPLVMPAAQVRYLRNTLALHAQTKPNGRALVMRSEIERVLGAARFGEQVQNARIGPNVIGLAEWAKERKSGQKTAKR